MLAISAPACSADSNAPRETLSADVVSDIRENTDASQDTASEDGRSNGEEDVDPEEKDAASADVEPKDATGDEDSGEDLGTPDVGSDEPDTNGTPENPFSGLTDGSLKGALRQTHRGHDDLGYDSARDFLFEYEMANNGPTGQIECVYTGRTAFVDDRSNAQSQHDYNTEHTWPQSRGASGVAKADLHHLFITDMPVNSRRSNNFFDDVVDVTWSEGGSKLGRNAAGETRFEPRDEHKGNVARAILYFSVVYNYEVNADEEAAMRAWHVLDPVDDAERARNDAIEGVQRSRNFFIDYPELVDQISDF
ncbi:endonuclease I [Bradymonas sediminis]|nr:endonuclease I [Bradymonas sediminis]